ncbi:MAG: heme-binding protein [Verrucomicrobiota bacterium]
MKVTRWVLSGLLTGGSLFGYEQAFPQTPPGEIQVKELPAGVLLESNSDASYFASSGKLFRPLFDYIDKRDIAMTTPVEAKVNPGEMYFWVAADEVDKVTGDTEQVRVVEVPERTVVSVGGRGSYSESNYREKEEELFAWLAANEQWKVVGDPVAVYWNGPFTLWFLKKFEVMVEVEPVAVDS